MTCDRCGESRTEGALFCPYCGADLREECPRCREYAAGGALFCGACGRRLPQERRPRRSPADRDLEQIERVSLVAVPAALVLLFLELWYMVSGTLEVWDWSADMSMSIYALVPNLVTVAEISGLQLQVAWILIEAAVLLSAVVLLWQSWTTVRDGEASAETLLETPVYRTSAVVAASLVASVALSLLLALLGVDIESADTPTGSDAEPLLTYADAAVWEEVIARVAPIGVPMAVAALICKRKGWWRMLFGGFGMSRLSVLLILLSALMFGFAHYSGWGLWKVLPTFATGLLLGYLYVRVGVHATIVAHFIIDYMAVTAYDTTFSMTVTSVAMLALLVLGIAVWILYAAKLWRNRGALKEMPNWMPPDQESSFSRRRDD